MNQHVALVSPCFDVSTSPASAVLQAGVVSSLGAYQQLKMST